MTVIIAPLSSDAMGSASYAADLADALRDSGPDTPSPRARLARPGTPIAAEGDILHVIAESAYLDEDRTSDVLRAGGGRPLVATLLDTGADGRRPVLPQAEAYARIVVLTDTACRQLVEQGVSPARVEVVPAWVPLPHPGPGSAPVASSILLMAPLPPPLPLLQEALTALEELPRDTTMTVALDANYDNCDGLQATVHRTAGMAGMSQRVHCTPLSARDDVHTAIGPAAAVIVAHPIVAGPWHALAPLAYGKPLIAPGSALFYDLMLRGHCVRLVRPDRPGHLAACLRAILGNPVGIEELRERGLRYARQHSLADTARRMAAIYQNVGRTAHAGGIP